MRVVQKIIVSALSAICCLCLCILAGILNSASADEEQNLAHPSDEDSAFTFDALLINDAWANVAGGFQRGVGVMGNLYLASSVDTSQLGWWDDGIFALEGIWIYGRRPSLAVGDYQFTSSIDSFDTFELYQAYYEHLFDDEEQSLLIGIHDLSTEFSYLTYGYTFLNSSFNTISTLTQIPYSLYPFTALGIRGYTQFADDYYLRVGFYDGKPTSFTRLRSRDYGLNAEDGLFSIAEIGYEVLPELEQIYSKFMLGGWHNSGTFYDIFDNKRTDIFGAYLQGEQEIWRECGTEDQGFGIFGQAGYAQKDRTFNPWYFGGGLHYRGLFKERDEDILALAYNLALINTQLRKTEGGYERDEQAWELSYRYKLSPDLTLVPDIQWVKNPGGRSRFSDSVILYIRSEYKL